MTNKEPNQSLPPQDLEAERALLGSLILNNDSIIKILDKINCEDFYKKDHQDIFKAILSLYEAKEPVDLITLSERLKKDKKLDDIGGVSYLTSIINNTPTAENIIHYAKIVKEKASLRELLNDTYKIQQQIESGKESAEIITEINNQYHSKLIARPTDNIPVSLSQFLKSDIPPIKYYISGLLPKKGKGMISATANIGKSLLAQNLSLAMACGITSVLNKFEISSARVLYLDLEMGESALKERFQKMTQEYPENLYIRYLPSMNLSDAKDRQLLESWLVNLKIEVLIIDPLGNAWVGNENEQQEVRGLTAYLNNLIENYGISILVVHHWRKATKEQSSGGQMAAGSYRFEAWLDCHITLEGLPSNITIICQKSRNAPRFNSFIAKINNETLWLEFITDFEKKLGEDILVQLFEETGIERVSVSDLANLAEKKKICSRSKIYDLVKESTLFKAETVKKKKYLIKKEAVKELL